MRRYLPVNIGPRTDDKGILVNVIANCSVLTIFVDSSVANGKIHIHAFV